MEQKELLKELCEWIAEHKLQENYEKDSLIKFAYDLQNEINRLGFSCEVAEGKIAVTYCGKTDAGFEAILWGDSNGMVETESISIYICVENSFL